MEAEDEAVGYRLREVCLEMSVRDYGVGVPETEIGLVTTKYYTATCSNFLNRKNGFWDLGI